MTEFKLVPTKAISDLQALMQELELVESSPFNKNTASRLSSWSHTWLKSHGHNVIAQFNALQDTAPPRVVDEVPQYVQAMRVQQWLCDEHDLIVPSQDIEDAMNNPLPPDSCVEIL